MYGVVVVRFQVIGSFQGQPMIHRFYLLLSAAMIASPMSLLAADPAPEASLAATSTSVPAKTVSFSITRGQLRSAATSWLDRSAERPPAKFGLEIDGDIAGSPSNRPLVVLIHGFNSSPERLAALRHAFHQAGYPTAALRYSSQETIAKSAALLSQELRQLAREQPNRKIALVTHSMGGLVARGAIENPTLDPGNVSQLIMIAPPTHGTSCAYLSLPAELLCHTSGGRDHSLAHLVLTGIENGLSEARDDLKPDSAYLEALNSHSRNPRVQYTVLLGTGTMFTPYELSRARQIVHRCALADSFIAAIEPACQSVLSDFEDAVAEGDGVVSLSRGRLDGVPDTVLLGFNHWNAIGPPEAEPVAALHREILSRLAGDVVAQNANSAP
jgi:pimeloyl-ACP methyl ester carboxylesterase